MVCIQSGEDFGFNFRLLSLRKKLLWKNAGAKHIKDGQAPESLTNIHRLCLVSALLGLSRARIVSGVDDAVTEALLL